MVSFFTVSGIFAAQAEDNGRQGCTLVRSDANGVVIRYVLPGIEEKTFGTASGEFTLISVPFCGYTEQIGAPQLPRAKCVLGMPLKGYAQVTVLNSEFEEKGGYRIAPVPTVAGDEEGGGSLQRSYVPDPQFYMKDGFYPRLVETGEPSFLRNQRIVGVLFSPVQFNPATGAIRIFSEITMSVRFDRPGEDAPQIQRVSPDRFEKTYARVLLNYETARAWRRHPVQAVIKESFWQEDQEWFRITVHEDGMYQLGANDLSAAGIDVAGLDPRTLRLFSGGGRELPQNIASPRPDSLQEVAIAVGGEEDGSFDQTDSILFFGQDLSGWDYDPDADDYTYYSHHYDEGNIYWLTYGGDARGKRMQSRDGSLQIPDALTVWAVRNRVHEETEVTNPANSGLDWYWHTSSSGQSKVFQVDLRAAIADSPCIVTARMKGKTTRDLGTHQARLYLNDHFLGSTTFYNQNATVFEKEGLGWVVDGTNRLELDHAVQSGSSGNDQLYFDWYEIRFWNRLQARNGTLLFTAPRGQRTCEFEIGGFSTGSISVYDVTDPFNVVSISNPVQSDMIRFQDQPDPITEKRYAVVDRSQGVRDAELVMAPLSALRSPANGADYLIITHDDFLADVEPLERHRRTMDGFAVKTVGTSSIYDAFAWGLFDPTAIRDFLKYTQDHWNPQPAYVLLVGDGNYDYLNHSLTSPGNWIPPYEQGGIAFDDWFVYLDGDGTPDLCIGRLPAQSRQQVQTMVEKIRIYDAEPLLGSWRNRVVLLADDEWIGCEYNHADDSWNTVHTQDSESISRYSIPRQFEQRKIYLVEYEMDQSCYKPDATDALLSTLNEGVTLFNYIGHGGYEVMAQERAFYAPRDLPRLQNERMPFLLAAFTCDLGVYDRPRDESMAEDLVRLAGKGAIATIAASRGTSSGPNLDLSQNFYASLFTGDAGYGSTASFGEALVEAKANVTTQSTARLYLLFGDPAQKLSMPGHQVMITLDPDTLQALELLTLEGKLVDTAGDLLQDFSGSAQVHVFDSSKETAHATPDGRKTVYYQLPGALLYRGLVPVVAGVFQTQFVIPKDITYGGNLGRIHAYVSDDENSDGAGCIDSLVTAGGHVAGVDSVGPSITMSIVGREDTFAEGDYVQSADTLNVALSDSSGINITGETGHWIVLQMDDDLGTRTNLTSLFYYDEGSHQSGSLRFPLSGFSDGDHVLEVIAWDNYNNVSVQSLSVRMVADDDLRIHNVMNYPNPFETETLFTYELTGPARDVHIKVYTVAGRLVKTLRNLPGELGFNQVPWEAVDEDGDRLANGVYLYKVAVNGPGGEHREQIGRLVVMK